MLNLTSYSRSMSRICFVFHLDTDGKRSRKEKLPKGNGAETEIAEYVKALYKITIKEAGNKLNPFTTGDFEAAVPRTLAILGIFKKNRPL